MVDELIEILEEATGLTVYRQGSLTGPSYPAPTFLTYWNSETDDGSHYDNGPISYVWEFQVGIYGDDPDTVFSTTLTAINALRANNWIISGKGEDAPTDLETHTGRTFSCLYIEQN